MDQTITIGKSYFEALLRRAEFHASGNEFSAPARGLCVTLSKVEHDHLLRAVREYSILRNALFRGGLTSEMFETLISGETEHGIGGTTACNSWEDSFAKPNPVSVTISAPHTGGTSPYASDSTAVTDKFSSKTQSGHTQGGTSFSHGDPFNDANLDKEDHFDPADNQPLPHPSFPRNDQRTILFTNLSDRTTHKDIVNVIRGGRLLDIYIRNDRSATVSFLEGAKDFLNYAKKKDIYICTKRIGVRWADRQFHLPNHVANKISGGATRNIVIRGADAKLSEKGIRDDLEHIHNLVVIEVKFKNGDAYISTNSINNALFARTCMMSRTAYKGLRIEWYPDECAASLPGSPSWKSQPPAPKGPVSAAIANRYTLLNIDGSDFGDSEEEEESILTSGVRVNSWTDATATVG